MTMRETDESYLNSLYLRAARHAAKRSPREAEERFGLAPQEVKVVANLTDEQISRLALTDRLIFIPTIARPPSGRTRASVNIEQQRPGASDGNQRKK